MHSIGGNFLRVRKTSLSSDDDSTGKRVLKIHLKRRRRRLQEVFVVVFPMLSHRRNSKSFAASVLKSGRARSSYSQHINMTYEKEEKCGWSVGVSVGVSEWL